jgi:DNA-binding XRE family transcriptional regulator
MQDTPRNFADQLITYRTMHNLSQAQLAVRVHTTRQIIANIENCRSEPRVKVYRALVELLSSSMYISHNPVQPLHNMHF